MGEIFGSNGLLRRSNAGISLDFKIHYASYHQHKQIQSFNPMRGSSFINTPPFIAKKRALLNLKNNDQECFIWAILSALLNFDRKEHTNRASKFLPFQNKRNFENISFLVVPNQISEF